MESFFVFVYGLYCCYIIIN